MSGWLPTEIVFKSGSQIIRADSTSDNIVRWMYFGQTSLNEPFFRQTVSKLREHNPPALEIELTEDSIFRAGRKSRNLLPLGFIFHASRCGSTLVSNALRIFDELQVVAEACPITGLFLPCGDQNYLSAGYECIAKRKNLAENLFNIFSTYREDHQVPIIVKFSSLNSICLPNVRNLWPTVPSIFIMRDPVEIIASNLRDWRASPFAESNAIARELCGADSSNEIPTEEYAARVIARYFDAAISQIGSNLMILDYKNINMETPRKIAKFFELALPDDYEEKVRSVFRVYSKDENKEKLYNRTIQEREISPEILHFSKIFALHKYQILQQSIRDAH
jgi:hypothetical protein